jgi:hypothetical protein
MKSHNVLYIESINVELGQDNYCMWYDSSINYSLKFNCPITGNEFRESKFVVYGKAFSTTEAYINAIENMLHGKRIDFEHDRCKDIFFECDIHFGVDHLEVSHLPDEWRDLFRELFSVNKDFEIESLKLNN